MCPNWAYPKVRQALWLIMYISPVPVSGIPLHWGASQWSQFVGNEGGGLRPTSCVSSQSHAQYNTIQYNLCYIIFTLEKVQFPPYPAVLKREYLELGIEFWHSVKSTDFVLKSSFIRTQHVFLLFPPIALRSFFWQNWQFWGFFAYNFQTLLWIFLTFGMEVVLMVFFEKIILYTCLKKY